MPASADASDPGGWAATAATAAGAATTGPTTGGPTTTGPTTGDALPTPPAADRFRDALAAALAPGLALAHELPGGGMARVFVATEVALGRRVVVKVLPPDLAAGINTERFRREIQLAAQLQHPHIVPLLAAGEVTAGGGTPASEAAGSLYYTMPFIEGESLRAEVAARAARGAAFTPREVLRILRDVADALGYAHARGVVHRDVKPGNVLLLHGHALVTDFGVAKALGVGQDAQGRDRYGRILDPPLRMTTLGMAIGTPAYMAPEQLAADPAADHRVDLYAAGLVAYELLTGASPFAAASPQATLAAQLTREPPALRTVRPDVPPALAAAVTACLAKDPAARPATAAALLAMLDTADEATAAMRWAATPATTPALAPEAGTADVPATTAVPAQEMPTAAVATRAPRRARGIAVLATGALLAVGATAWVTVGRTGVGRAPATSAAGTAGGVGPARTVGPVTSAPSVAVPTVAPPAPALSRADSEAIAAAVAREFERALARRQAAGGGAAAAGAVRRAPGGAGAVGGALGAGSTLGTEGIPGLDGAGRATGFADALGAGGAVALRRAARDAVADSLVRAEHWGRYSHAMVRAIVGRLPVPLPPDAPVPPGAPRELDEAHRVIDDALRRIPRGSPGTADGEVPVVLRGRYRGFAAITAGLTPPRAGVRRVALVFLRDETGVRAFAPLAPMLDAALRARLGVGGRYEFTDPAVGAVARREGVPDPLVAGATGAGAVARGAVDLAGDVAVATIVVFDARRGTQVTVEARVAAAPGASLPAVADALAEPLARGAERALGGVAWEERPARP